MQKGNYFCNRAMSLILTVVILFALVFTMVGCGTNNQKSTKDNASATQSTSEASAGQEPASADTHQLFTLWMSNAGSSTDDNTVQKLWSSKLGFNVHVEWTQGDALTALNLKLNSGGFDDLACFPNNQTYTSAFIKSGLVMPVDDILKDSKYPSFGKIPEKILSRIKSSDGHYWYLPGWFDQNPDDPWPGWSSYAFIVATDLLDKLAMTEADLGTLDGVEKYLRAVAKLKTPEGKPMIPLSYYEGGSNVILNAFGVNTGVANGGITAVKKSGDQFIFPVDDPGYKQAYQWMNKLYSEGLMDKEVVTQKVELFKQKSTQGLFGMSVGSMFDFTWQWEPLDGPTAPAWYLKPVKNPAVPGVEKVGTASFIDPFAQYSLFISKNTKKLDSILAFLNYSLEPSPIRQMELGEGPIGINWNWTNGSMGEWKYEDAYGAERMSGDQARVAKVTNEIWQLATCSKAWYPWWTVAPGPNTKKGFAHTKDFTQLIYTFGNVQTVHSYDSVTMPKGGLWEKYKPTLDAVRKDFEARLLMAKNASAFDTAWNDYMTQLEQRAHWSELKKEWISTYQEYVKANGEW